MVVSLPGCAVTAQHGRVCLFGKMPAHGDFVARGLSRAMQQDIDDWLSRSLEQARMADPDSFEDRYATAPPCLFRFPEGAAAEEGVLVPSIDAVGRRFPLMIKHALIDGMEPGRLAAACADLAREAIVSRWDADMVANKEIDPRGGDWYTDPPVGGNCWWTPTTERYEGMYREGRRPAGLMVAMLAVGDAIG